MINRHDKTQHIDYAPQGYFPARLLAFSPLYLKEDIFCGWLQMKDDEKRNQASDVSGAAVRQIVTCAIGWGGAGWWRGCRCIADKTSLALFTFQTPLALPANHLGYRHCQAISCRKRALLLWPMSMFPTDLQDPMVAT